MLVHDEPIGAPLFPNYRPAPIHGFFGTILRYRVGVPGGRGPGKISALMGNGIFAQDQLERGEVG